MHACLHVYYSYLQTLIGHVLHCSRIFFHLTQPQRGYLPCQVLYTIWYLRVLRVSDKLPFVMAEATSEAPLMCTAVMLSAPFCSGCLRNRDYTVYTCCDETHERVKVNGKYVCQPPSNFTEVKQPKFTTPADFPGEQCPKEFVDDYPSGYTEDSFLNEA